MEKIIKFIFDSMAFESDDLLCKVKHTTHIRIAMDNGSIIDSFV